MANPSNKETIRNLQECLREILNIAIEEGNINSMLVEWLEEQKEEALKFPDSEHYKTIAEFSETILSMIDGRRKEDEDNERRANIRRSERENKSIRTE